MYTLILVSVRDADGGGRQRNPVPEVRPSGRPSVRRWADLPPPRGLGRRRAQYISSVGNETCPLPPPLLPSLSLSISPCLFSAIHAVCLRQRAARSLGWVVVYVQMARQTFFKRKNSGQRELRRRRRRRIHAAFRADATEEQITPPAAAGGLQ